MSDRDGFRVEGLRELTRNLEQLGADVEDLKDAFGAIATEGAERAAFHAPKVSGTLAATIRGNRAKSKAVVTAGRARVPYAPAINYGYPAHNIEPSRFMQKADQDLRPFAIEKLNDEVRHRIRARGMNQ